MITLTRTVIRNVRAALRKAGIHKAKADKNPPVALVAGHDGLFIRAMSHVAALEYHDNQPAEPETIWLPAVFLDDCEGGKAEPVTIERLPDGRVTAQFRDKNIPQLLQYDAVPDKQKADAFPACPDKLVRNEMDLLPALVAATENTDPNPTRYALSNMMLSGEKGAIEATDGRHFLRQSGFAFPWQENVLVPGSKFFTFGELDSGQPVEVGKSGKSAVFRVGPWTIWLPIDENGRFPKTDGFVPAADAAISSCRLSAADADFLIRSLDGLPADSDGGKSVTLDLNGHVAVRSKARDSAEPTEIILTSSVASGEPIRTAVDRRYLARAARLGLRDIRFFGEEKPALCRDERRSYIWAAVERGVVPRSDKAVRIESPAEAAVAAASQPTTPHKETIVNTVKTDTAPAAGQPEAAAAEPRRRRAGVEGQTKPAGNASPIEQAKAIRAILKQALAQNNELIHELKRHERQARLVANTLDSLKQLKVA